MKVGVLAMQGAFIEHEKALARVGVEPVEVRLPEHLEGLEGLIIPGGESTTIGQVAEQWGLLDPIRDFARSGQPLWGTCAGMILMAKEVVDAIPGQPILGVMDVAVRRNVFGRQVDSFETDMEMPVLGDPPFHAVFIRAPLIERVGKGVEILAQFEDGTVVAARQGNLLATAFHPELAEDDRFHRYFVDISEVS
jgi:5'-phosphate synthase pdxT subunit